jgi:exosortase A-associated hydrolase 1
MRTALSFACQGAVLAATLDDAAGTSGLLIVSGGNELRCGAHRGMAALAAQIAAAGHPVLRFDRRGIGDSEGENGGFESSRDDIGAAVAAFRAACPAMTHVIAFGNCDAASALALHQLLAVDALVLANPWTIEAAADDAPALPPAAAIRARYWQRLRDPASLLRLLRGEVDFGKLARGIAKLAPGKPAPPPGSLGSRVVAAIAKVPVPVTLLLATGDRTAQAFAEHWRGVDPAAHARVLVAELASASHSFAGEDGAWLAERLLQLLAEQAMPQ